MEMGDAESPDDRFFRKDRFLTWREIIEKRETECEKKLKRKEEEQGGWKRGAWKGMRRGEKQEERRRRVQIFVREREI